MVPVVKMEKIYYRHNRNTDFKQIQTGGSKSENLVSMAESEHVGQGYVSDPALGEGTDDIMPWEKGERKRRVKKSQIQNISLQIQGSVSKEDLYTYNQVGWTSSMHAYM